ncbi:DUF2479 domain-containing protein, partial [Listeria monocytogenes]|nr:DUF2479 domain-containing protein [Listeria monocytogenes]
MEFHFKDQQGKPVDMLGTKVRLLLIVKVEGEEKEFKTLDEEIVTESSLNGIVRYIIPDRLMGYQGIVDGWIYLDFPDGSKTDEVRFRFTMARSKIDEEVPLIQEFYVPQFEEMLESVKTDLNEDVALAKSKINQSVTETQNVAQVEQGKIQEELPKIQTELSTINADIEAQKEKLEAASIYSKAEVDSKVADLDSVKADKTFVDAQLAETESQLEFQANADIPIVIPTYDGNNQTTHPKVLYFETPWNGYKYWMAHTPYANSNDRLENPSLCVSNDGITWAEPNGLVNPLDKPIDTTISHMSDNDLLMRGNVMEIWYRETIRNGGGDIIYRKTSTNGLTWSDREIVFQTGAGGQILSPSTLYEDGKYKMWYVSNFEIHYMESTNGIEWTTPIEVTVNYEK